MIGCPFKMISSGNICDLVVTCIDVHLRESKEKFKEIQI